MSAASTIADPTRVFYGAQEVAQNPGIIDFSFEAAIPFDADRFPVRVRSTWNGIEEIRGHIARLEERALQAEANLRDANARCRQFEKRAERADEAARDLIRADFEWEDTIPVDEINGKRILVQVRGTEGGIKRIKAFIAREEHASDKLHESLLAAEARIKALEAEQADALASVASLENLVWHNGLLNRSLALASDRALAAEAKLAALEAEQAEAFASVASFEVLPVDTTTYTVSHGGATMTVTGSPSGVANVVKLAYGGFEYGVSA